MPEVVIEAVHRLAQILEIVGAAALILGFVIATLHRLLKIGHLGLANAITSYRQAIGRTILVGLEILVAATIIKTITLEPTVEGVGLLAVMIAIRTGLGWSTFLEMNGRWPWQKKPSKQGRDG